MRASRRRWPLSKGLKDLSGSHSKQREEGVHWGSSRKACGSVRVQGSRPVWAEKATQSSLWKVIRTPKASGDTRDWAFPLSGTGATVGFEQRTVMLRLRVLFLGESFLRGGCLKFVLLSNISKCPMFAILEVLCYLINTPVTNLSLEPHQLVHI